MFLPFILTACSKDEPELDLFHITLGIEADAEIGMGLHSAEVTCNSNHSNRKWPDGHSTYLPVQCN